MTQPVDACLRLAYRLAEVLPPRPLNLDDNACPSFTVSPVHAEQMHIRFQMLVEALAPALQAAMQGWIPVSERLPDRKGLGSVLAYDADRPGKGVWLETIHPSWWGQFLADSNEWAPNITHWQPLPTPPTAAEPGEA